MEDTLDELRPTVASTVAETTPESEPTIADTPEQQGHGGLAADSGNQY